MSWRCRNCGEYYSKGNPCSCWLRAHRNYCPNCHEYYGPGKGNPCSCSLETHSSNDDDYDTYDDYPYEIDEQYEVDGNFFGDKWDADDYCRSEYGYDYDTCSSAWELDLDPAYYRHIMDKENP